jgi:hypothetical protein
MRLLLPSPFLRSKEACHNYKVVCFFPQSQEDLLEVKGAPCSTSPEFVWTLTSATEQNTYYITQERDGLFGMCLDMHMDTKNIYVSPCHYGDNQKFIIPEFWINGPPTEAPSEAPTDIPLDIKWGISNEPEFGVNGTEMALSYGSVLSFVYRSICVV